jgi:hypothetical protein
VVSTNQGKPTVTSEERSRTAKEFPLLAKLSAA